ncbi:PleD family two-component system response regulator [Pendulispora albinea]|uniref:Response regulator n=1 Tax=Pendulispora albinea TaxID=2741071 RepID=A0ABZ2LQB7_9BACT
MSRKKILLVDDSSTALLMERMILQRDYECVEAKDGMEGLAKAAQERPDLIVLDVVMPVMDGFETCRKLREQESTRTTPVIMVTTRGEGKNVEAGFVSGCTDYVTKPISSIELLAKVKSCLGE